MLLCGIIPLGAMPVSSGATWWGVGEVANNNFRKALSKKSSLGFVLMPSLKNFEVIMRGGCSKDLEFQRGGVVGWAVVS